MAANEEDYSPEQIRYWLEHWRELEIAAEGATGSLNGQGGGKRGRMDTVVMLADLERATDQLPLEWAATRAIYDAQGRAQVWLKRRQLDAGITLDQAIARMARALGWRP
jgi:hypothetical protein